MTSTTLADGRGNSYLTTYDYPPVSGTANVTSAAVNSLGTALGYAGPTTYPLSAPVYYAYKGGHLPDLAVGDQREFRGHATVIERSYNGPTTAAPLLQWVEHSFYQGDGNGCQPAGISDGDSCFVLMKAREFQKGREWQTVWKRADGAILRSETHIFRTDAPRGASGVDYTAVPYRGVWRGWAVAQQVDERVYEGGTTPVGKTTAYCYNGQKQAVYNATTFTLSAPSWGQGQYGNQTHVLEYDRLVTLSVADLGNCDAPGGSVAPYRITRTSRVIRDDVGTQHITTANAGHLTYLADRLTQRAVFTTAASGPNALAITEYAYDGFPTEKRLGTTGRVTAACAVRDATASPYVPAVTTYGYDAWGNQTTVTTYSTWGARTDYGAGRQDCTPPGSGGRTTMIAYDGVFHALPTQQTNPGTTFRPVRPAAPGGRVQRQ